jgi:hypothetical protein
MCAAAQFRVRDRGLIQQLGATTAAQFPFYDNRHAERKEAIRADLGRRLRRICPDYTDDEFAELIDMMADRQLKGERRLNGSSD